MSLQNLIGLCKTRFTSICKIEGSCIDEMVYFLVWFTVIDKWILNYLRTFKSAMSRITKYFQKGNHPTKRFAYNWLLLNKIYAIF